MVSTFGETRASTSPSRLIPDTRAGFGKRGSRLSVRNRECVLQACVMPLLEKHPGVTRCASDISQNASSFASPSSLYPPVYPPMALALPFDRAFENPFLRRRLPARSMYWRTPTPVDIPPRIRAHPPTPPPTYIAHTSNVLGRRGCLPASAYPGIRGALIPF